MTVTLYSIPDGHGYVPAHPGLSTRYANVYAVANVPDGITPREVAKRATMTSDVRPGFVDRKVLDFSDLSDGTIHKILAR